MRRRDLLGFVLASALAGCLAPSLPLPPPYEPQLGPSKLGPDFVHLKGTGEPGALIIVYNPDAPDDKVGVIAEVQIDRRWECDIYAKPGDVLRIWQELGGQPSPYILVQVR